jgi:hypothetical protein
LTIENYQLQTARNGGAGHQPVRQAWHSPSFQCQMSPIFIRVKQLPKRSLGTRERSLGTREDKRWGWLKFPQLSILNSPFSVLASMVLVGVFLCAAASARTAEDSDAVEPPVAYRPANFSGAIGSGYRVRMRAAPTELQAEDSLTLTVSITGKGMLQEIPRPDLRRLPRFAQQFQIDNVADRYDSALKTREFDYRLRPRTAAVKEVPALPFVFFNPKILPREKGYQTTFAQAIALTVRPRLQVSPARVEGPPAAVVPPASVYSLVEGHTALRYDPPFTLPPLGVLVFLLVGPPAVGGLWYMVWQRHYPDAMRQMRKRRSRAAQQALKALQRARKRDVGALAQQAEAIVARYLRQRLDLVTAEPTPMEVARHLERLGGSSALGQQVERFFADCDAARFAPGLMEKPNDPTATAARLVVALEEEPWPPQFS